MQSLSSASWGRKTEYFRSVLYSSMAPLSILCATVIGILPALKSEAFANGSAGRTPNARATAVASARVIKPITSDTAVPTGTGARNFAITVLRRTSVRSCKTILGSDGNHVAGASCELRLIELQ